MLQSLSFEMHMLCRLDQMKVLHLKKVGAIQADVVDGPWGCSISALDFKEASSYCFSVFLNIL